MSVQQVLGAGLMLLFLADIFLTVLYARAGTGLLAPRWNRLVWAGLKGSSALFGRRRGSVLSLAGPLIVILLIAFWALGLTTGAALIIQPELGTSIRPSSGDAPRDFVTALMVAGNSLSIVGGGDYSPHTTGARLLFLVNSLIGASAEPKKRPRTRLTDEEVDAMRTARERGIGVNALARQFGVHRGTVWAKTR